MKICLYGASSSSIDPGYINAAEELGRELARRGHGLVFGGGANGMMGAAARGVRECGGEILGISPRFFDVEGVLYEHCTDLVFTNTIRERKQLMEDSADAFIVTPGGIGTYEEFYEILTLRQLGRHAKAIALYNVRSYFEPLRAVLEHAIKEKFLSEECRELYYITEDLNELLDYLENARPELVDLWKIRK